MKRYKAFLLFYFLTLSFVFANGDPVATLSSLTQSANPSPKQIVDIQIVKEELYIQPSKNTKVRVKYTLHNTSGKDYDNIDYGFPVDYTGAGMINANVVSDIMSESVYTVGWHDFYIKHMAFSINGNALPYTMSEETVVKRVDRQDIKAEYADIFGEEDNLSDKEIEDEAQTRDVSRRWFYTRFSIKAGQTCQLEVEYTLQNRISVPLYGLNTISSSSSRIEGFGHFDYDMSPAQHWGDGTANELLVEIDYSNTLQSQDDEGYREIYNRNNTLGLAFVEKGRKMTYTAKNFNFKDSEPISLTYYTDFNTDYQDLLSHRISPSTYTITASDELAAYPISNLSDSDLSTAWATKWEEGKNKTFKIAFKKPTIIGAIIVVGGYHKSVDTYKNNAQPKVISIDLGNDEGEEYLRSLEDNFAEQIVKYEGISDKNILGYSLFYIPGIFTNTYYNPVKEITLNISEVFPGAKFDDLCISEIIILNPDYAPRIGSSTYE